MPVDPFDALEAHFNSMRSIIERLKEQPGDEGIKEDILKRLKDLEGDVFDLVQ